MPDIRINEKNKGPYCQPRTSCLSMKVIWLSNFMDQKKKKKVKCHVSDRE